jgi:hypothetical protein
MSEFTYIFRGGAAPGSPDLTQQRMQKWVAWMKDLGEKGQLKNPGNPLEPTGKLVKGNQKTVTDGPYAESKDIVGGYMVIEARDVDHAVEISKNCPIFEAGGSVEVRPVMKLNM